MELKQARDVKSKPENLTPKTLYDMLLRHWRNVVRGFQTLDHVLRRTGANARSPECLLPDESGKANLAGPLTLSKVFSIVFVCGPVYGVAMGSYAMVVGKRTFIQQVPQMLYSGLKVPLLILITVAVALPSFFVINTLLGLRDDFRVSLRAIVSAQAGLTVILVSLFPLTLFGYVSFAPMESGYAIAVLFNAAMLGLASVSAQKLLRAYYQPLIVSHPRHRWMVRLWIFLYAFVGIQAAYLLRPFIGNPDLPPTFFRKESFENAYVKVIELFVQVASELMNR